ncbi:MAG TPA: MBL fold metallo-hydrolase [Sedimenticola thiotaurini]|uniref:MBL fold metallo-hydrolase n=1 Tax=Sedimenticola thiotaurini TaxID=1543721 RepID=A0A831W6T8_9GAMM|nr:MBL fold metallo-hydrolase [Sedimenticola thiotaurini]
MRLQKVSDHVYLAQGKAGIATDNQGFISNAVVILTGREVVVVDALGTPSLGAMLLERIRQLTDLPVTTVITTHYHADHIYGLQVFKEQGARIIAPAGYADYLDAPIGRQRLEERRVSLRPWVNERTRLVRPDLVIDRDQTLQFGDVTLKLGYLGEAHSDGDLMVLVVPDQVLISGDLIFEGRIPFTGGADTRHWLQLLEDLDRSDLAAIIPGHGAVIDDPWSTVGLTLRYLRFVREKMAAAVEEMIPFADAYDAVDWSRFSDLPAFDATNRRNAYGVYLSLERESMGE